MPESLCIPSGHFKCKCVSSGLLQCCQQMFEILKLHSNGLALAAHYLKKKTHGMFLNKPFFTIIEMRDDEMELTSN